MMACAKVHANSRVVASQSSKKIRLNSFKLRLKGSAAKSHSPSRKKGMIKSNLSGPMIQLMPCTIGWFKRKVNAAAVFSGVANPMIGKIPIVKAQPMAAEQPFRFSPFVNSRCNTRLTFLNTSINRRSGVKTYSRAAFSKSRQAFLAAKPQR